MTLEELESVVPNGFHDARLVRLTLDYLDRTATLHMQLFVGTPESEDPEEYKAPIVRLTGLCFFSIDLPDPNEQFVPDGSPVSVSGYSEDSTGLLKPNESIVAIDTLMKNCPLGASSYRFYSYDWNSFIHIACTDANLEWNPASGNSSMSPGRVAAP
jgi:hypothetical protein